MDNIKEIVKYISEGESKKELLGVELEHFVCDKQGNLVGYKNICKLLELLQDNISCQAIYEQEHLMGLKCPKYTISLEPGGQLEVSLIACEAIEDIEKIYHEFRKTFDGILKEFGYELLENGVFPLVENGEITPEQLELIPKKRYYYMNRYFEKTGKYGKYMMRATAATQISIDYKSMEDCVRKLRLIHKISPLLALLMENQSGLETMKNMHPHLYRTQIWNSVDDDRCGYIEGCLGDDFSYEKYAEYVYHKPFVVISDANGTNEVGDKSAKEYLNGEKIAFIEHLLSMFFFHVRLKQCIEIRIADSVPLYRMLGYVALLKGILYSEKAMKELEQAFSCVKTLEDIKCAEAAIMREGYDAVVYGREIKAWLAFLYETAGESLSLKEQNYLKKVLTLPLVEYLYTREIPSALEAHRESAKAEKEYILNSTAKYHERVVRTLYTPKLFTEKEAKIFEQIIENIFGIFDKVIAEYKRNAEFRKCFSFDKRLEELILKESAYECNIPMARIDVFLDEPSGQFKFCEFNTDGASAMNEDRELNIALKLTKAYENFTEKFNVSSYELFDSWIDEFLEIYKGSVIGKERQELPKVAIVDFLENATLNEFKIFKERFEKRGVVCEICDIRELAYRDGKCVSPTGMQIDAIYRRAVTGDILKHYDEVGDFINCVKNNCVCVLGEFKTQIAHNKILFKVLHSKEHENIFNEKEKRFIKAHVPYTTSLTKKLFEEDDALKQSVYQNKNKWIIKPEDSYGSKGVLAGVECTDEKWTAFVTENLDKNYILQEFCVPYKTRNIDLTLENIEDCKWRETSNLTGLFAYNKKFKGVYSRVSFDEMISTQYNEMSLPTIVVD